MQALKRLDRIECTLDYIAQKLGTPDRLSTGDSISWPTSLVPSTFTQRNQNTPSPTITSKVITSNVKQKFACSIPNILHFRHPSAERSEWSWNVSEHFFDAQLDDAAELHEQAKMLFSDLDFSELQIWNLQQSFMQNVLRWYPICDTETLMQHLQFAGSIGYLSRSASSCFALLVFSIGAVSSGPTLYSRSAGDIPGFQYFATALSILDLLPLSTKDLTIVQCRVMASIFLIFALQPLEAWKTINQASQDCIFLLRSHTYRESSPEYREAFSRLYWTCYMIETELEACLEISPSGLRLFAGQVPLPISRFEEEGMYFLLARVSLRKILLELLDSLDTDFVTGYLSYSPAVALELRTQIEEWYRHLPESLQFTLETRPLHDTRKSYLRCAYYGLLALVTWPFVMPLSEPSMSTSQTNPKVNSTAWPLGPTSHPSPNVPTLLSQNECQPYRRASPMGRRTPTPGATSPHMSHSPIVKTNSFPSHRQAAQTCIESCRAFLAHAEEILSTKSLVSHLVVQQYFSFTMVLILTFNGVEHSNAKSSPLEEKAFLERAMNNLRCWASVPFVAVSLAEMRRIGNLRGLNSEV